MLIFWNNVKYLCPIKNNPCSETIECIYPLHKLMKKIKWIYKWIKFKLRGNIYIYKEKRKYKLNNMYGQIRLLYIIGLSILIQLILQLLKGLLFGFSISLESHSCWQYRRIKSFLGLIQGFLVHDEFDANISERQEQDYTVLSFLFDSG